MVPGHLSMVALLQRHVIQRLPVWFRTYIQPSKHNLLLFLLKLIISIVTIVTKDTK